MVTLVQCDPTPNWKWYFILELRNENKDSFFNNDLISDKDHYHFMESHWNNYFIVYNSDECPVGFIRINLDDISVCIKKKYQGLGYGTEAIKELTSRLTPPFCARIKPDNIASQKAFEKAGYKLHHYTYYKI